MRHVVRQRKGERGHLMAGLMVAVTLMLIFSMVTFQAWKDLLHRENEAEMMFRAQDLVRAIQRYRRDHSGQGPVKLEDLMEEGPKGQYYLRKLWTDPLVKDGKWGLLFMGPSGAIIDPTAEETATGQPGAQAQGLRGLGQQSLLNPQTQTPATPANAGRLGGVGNSRPGAVQEGLPIAGVKSLCKEHTFRVYNGLSEYSQWWFTYLDLERTGQGGPATGTGLPGGAGRPGQAGQPGQPGGQPGVPGAAGTTAPTPVGGNPATRPEGPNGLKVRDDWEKKKKAETPWERRKE